MEKVFSIEKYKQWQKEEGNEESLDHIWHKECEGLTAKEMDLLCLFTSPTWMVDKEV